MNRGTAMMKYLIRHPAKAAAFQATGREPAGQAVGSPLITLLESIPPRDRAYLWTGVTLGEDLGYLGRATFQNAEQLLRWLKPAEYLFDGESNPAECRRIKAFARPLSLQDLARHCSRHPLPARESLQNDESELSPTSV